MKKYHGKKFKDDIESDDDRLAKATSTCSSFGGFNRRDDDWGIRSYEALRVNRTLERRIVITRWMIKELEENEYYEEWERGGGVRE